MAPLLTSLSPQSSQPTNLKFCPFSLNLLCAIFIIGSFYSLTKHFLSWAEPIFIIIHLSLGRDTSVPSAEVLHCYSLMLFLFSFLRSSKLLYISSLHFCRFNNSAYLCNKKRKVQAVEKRFPLQSAWPLFHRWGKKLEIEVLIKRSQVRWFGHRFRIPWTPPVLQTSRPTSRSPWETGWLNIPQKN